MKFGAQLGALGVKDRRQELALAKELGCQGMEVTLPVGDLRSGKTTLAGAIAALWSVRSDRYSEIRASQTAPRRKIEMSYIGG